MDPIVKAGEALLKTLGADPIVARGVETLTAVHGMSKAESELALKNLCRSFVGL